MIIKIMTIGKPQNRSGAMLMLRSGSDDCADLVRCSQTKDVTVDSSPQAPKAVGGVDCLPVAPLIARQPAH
jgi:hypothetical protein